ncbi:amidase, Asp-tRNAAsn/Glu-tRNAGln amidotransferase A subunit [Caulobacter sp. AP07]|uniref:amidase n=1 Tax=Caulobacter sp. AP07 TaxID=1144304 RepID=UPI0002720C6D|nr:amidase [Caulobacter sp. AP07]EJL27354.1 amidase, Asp-tRNAAsn/Glu-tRNAGln amidotransferase A subunit [Caulobacter sp. AP07]
MQLHEYASFDGLGLADLVKRRQISRREVARCGLNAITAMNSTLNAVIEVYDYAVAKLDDGPDLENRPFFGVPFLLKDIGSHDADVKHELGSRLTKGLNAPPFASELVNRFRGSGVTILGRTNIPELGTSCTTEPLLYGPTLNPWDLSKSPGGSSGGAAAAVASGMTPIAHANDAGGSIRWPAACCGLFGLKPSRNLNPVGPDAGLPVNGYAAEHIVSRTVRDSAAMLDATAGPDAGPWCYTPRLSGSYLAETMRPAGKLRIGLNLHTNFPPTPLQATVVEATLEAARLCESLGHQVEEAKLEFDHEALLQANYVIWASGIRRGVLDLSTLVGLAPSPDTIEPHNLAAFHAAEAMTAADLQGALASLNMISRAYGDYFSRYDVMLTPTGSREPSDLGALTAIKADTFYDWYIEMMKFCPFTASVNMAGVPAMSVPLVHGKSGLPIGSHFVAGLGQEAMLLRLASQLESANPWADRVPPIHVRRFGRDHD